jgi:hypothetical protein
MGKSPTIDHAPVSVQMVKALEFEMRELAAAVVCGFPGGICAHASLPRRGDILSHLGQPPGDGELIRSR